MIMKSNFGDIIKDIFLNVNQVIFAYRRMPLSML